MSSATTPSEQPRVVVLRWPEELDQVEHLRAAGTPRLLLVAADTPAPVTTDCDEDWIRLPAADDDVRVRASMLAARSARHTPGPVPKPVMKGDGRVAFRGHWVALSQMEEAIAAVLLEHFGEVVDLEALRTGEHPPSEGAVRVHLTRLRKRIRPLGLAIHAVHGRGYVLEHQAQRAVG
ncbi:MAG: helix-turn-helix domain-containing protein [Acidimicrobiales bacterium]